MPRSSRPSASRKRSLRSARLRIEAKRVTRGRFPPGAAVSLAWRRSGLPGPRSNLTLLAAAADVLPREVALRFASKSDEYLACCGVAAVGRLILEAPDDLSLVELLTARAADERWRVREAAAIAGQLIGDQDAVRLRTLVADWRQRPTQTDLFN